MTFISWSTDFASYQEDYLMYEQHNLGLCVSMTRSFDLKINVGHCDLYLYPWHLCRGVYSFLLSVHMFVGLFVHSL